MWYKEHIVELEGDPYLLTMPTADTIERMWDLEMLPIPAMSSFACRYNAGRLTVKTYNNTPLNCRVIDAEPDTDDYMHIMSWAKPIRFYFALIPLDASDKFATSLQENYQDGEVVPLGVFTWVSSPMAAPRHTPLSGDALARLVPTKWDREHYSIFDPDEAGCGDNPELIEWVHYKGILVSKWPYFQSRPKDCLEWKYLPVRRELYV